MALTYLDFEQSVAELEAKIEELRFFRATPPWTSPMKCPPEGEGRRPASRDLHQAHPLADLSGGPASAAPLHT